MAKCVSVKRRRLRACVGEMKERLFVENRELEPPNLGDLQADFTFTAHESATEV